MTSQRTPSPAARSFAPLGLTVALVATACGAGPSETVAKPSASEAPTTPPPALATTAPLDVPPACASPAPRSLVVCPSSGPVGTRVVIAGNACHDAELTSLMLTFERLADDQEPGAAEITRDAAVDGNGRFAVEWVVPADVGRLQGSGGGPTTPGRYTIRSKPPLYPDPCRAEFRVT